jgi:putative YphP/YqiW family bacilliredoxin
MRYPEELIRPMREDLTRHGIEEARTREQVDNIVLGSSATAVLMVVNSVCGCAAGKARPGVVEALKHRVRPDRAATVFAGGDVEATARVRELTGLPPSSPSVFLFRGGKPIYAMHRYQIENRSAAEIAAALKQAFEEHCAAPLAK